MLSALGSGIGDVTSTDSIGCISPELAIEMVGGGLLIALEQHLAQPTRISCAVASLIFSSGSTYTRLIASDFSINHSRTSQQGPSDVRSAESPQS